MSWNIKKVSNGFKIISSITDEPIHEGIISENQVKAMLIVRAIEQGLNDALRVKEYPAGFITDGKMNDRIKQHEYMHGADLIKSYNELVDSIKVSGVPKIEVK